MEVFNNYFDWNKSVFLSSALICVVSPSVSLDMSDPSSESSPSSTISTETPIGPSEPPPSPRQGAPESREAAPEGETEEEKAVRLLYCSLCKVAVNSASQLQAHNSGEVKGRRLSSSGTS